MKTEKVTIYVVDDSSIALETVTNELQDKVHCTVKGFSSAEDCIHRMEDGLPDLIISDYYLDSMHEKRMNGDQMLAHIKNLYPSIPVIMYSSQNTADVVIRLMKLGAIDFIPKEKNFLKTIGKITHQQIKKLQHNSEMKAIARGLVFLLALFAISLIVVDIYIPKALPYVIFAGPIVIFLWAMAVNGKPSSKTADDIS